MRKKIDAIKNKNNIQYTFGGVRVSYNKQWHKQFLIKTLGISNRRLDYVVQNKAQSTDAGLAPKDSRGKQDQVNKLQD